MPRALRPATIALGLLPFLLPGFAEAAQVRILTEPAGAEVWVSGNRVGVTGQKGLVLELPTGPLALVIQKGGYQRLEKTIVVRGDLLLQFTLVPEGTAPKSPAAPGPEAAAPSRTSLRVTAARANVRLNPNLQSPAILAVPAGTVLDSTGKEGDWYVVILPGEGRGRQGYIAAPLVELLPQAATAAPPSAPRPPAPPAAAPPAPAPAAPAPPPPPAAVWTPLPPADPEMAAPRAETAAPPPRQAGSFPGSAPKGQAERGDREVLVFANVFATFGGGSTSAFGNVFLNYGKFIDPSNEIGGGPNISISSTGGGGDLGGDLGGSSTSVTIGLNLFYRHYFDTKGGQWYPYLGVQVDITDLSPDSGTSLGGDLAGVDTGTSILDVSYGQVLFGAKNYLTENLALDIQGAFGLNIGSPSSGQSLRGTFGLSYIF